MVLFFGLGFFVGPLLWNFSANALGEKGSILCDFVRTFFMDDPLWHAQNLHIRVPVPKICKHIL